MRLRHRQLQVEEERLLYKKEKTREDQRLRELEIERNFEIAKMRMLHEKQLNEQELKYKYNVM